MSLIKKSDVKNHLSARYQKRIHVAPESQPDATGFSGTNQTAFDTNQLGFAQDFTGDHTTGNEAIALAVEPAATPQPRARADFGPSKP